MRRYAHLVGAVMTPPMARALGRRGRSATPPAVQEALFDVPVRPELRYFGLILDAFARSDLGVSALDAEVVVSRLCGVVWAGQEGRRDGSIEETFGLGLVERAAQHRRPTTVALLRTLSVVAPILEVRHAAVRVAAALTASGLPEPTWVPPVGQVWPGRCWAYEELFGDYASVVCEYGYESRPGSGRRHAVVVSVDHANFSVATDVALAEDVDPLILDLRTQAKRSGSRVTLRQVDPGWARTLLLRAFARTDLIEGVVVGPSFADLRALALARLAALPEGSDALPLELGPPSEADRRRIVAEFLSSPEAEALAVTPGAAAVVDLIVEYGCSYDPAAVERVSPAKWDIFLHDWLPRTAGPDQAPLDTVPAVVRAWTEWSARRTVISDLAREELAQALTELLE